MIFIAVPLLTASCSPYRPKDRESLETEMPPRFSPYEQGAERPDRWWEEFNAPELNALVEEAFSGNFSLKIAWMRLTEARALAVQAGADLYPDLTGNADISLARQRSQAGSANIANTRTIKESSLGLFSSYELDFWGRIRSEQEAAILSAEATQEDLYTAAMTLAGEVAERWANIISQGMQKRLLDRQFKTNLTFLELVELRFRKSMVSALDVYQQKLILEQVRAEIPLVEQEEQLLRHELALLLGKPPQTALDIQRQTLPLPGDIPGIGLPADLLAARPDVRAAGLRLASADWQVAAARADRLPAISMSASAMYGPAELDLIFDNWFLSLAGNLAAPIFDGKRRAAEVDRARAVADENMWLYRETVFRAMKEVEDALVSETTQRKHIQGLELQIDAARNGLEQAIERYRKGLNDYLPVLTQLLAVQRLERDLIRQRALLIIDRINLYRALGGTWMGALQPPQQPEG
jgi:NodT family efflux transporter outer membrane factor (OMF) lipoprotein